MCVHLSVCVCVWVSCCVCVCVCECLVVGVCVCVCLGGCVWSMVVLVCDFDFFFHKYVHVFFCFCACVCVSENVYFWVLCVILVSAGCTYVCVYVCVLVDLLKSVFWVSCVCVTLDPKSFEYQFLATLDEMGQGIPKDGDKRGERKGYQCDQN